MTKFLSIAGRILLGGMFCFTGLNGFLHFVPMPPPEGAAGALLAAFSASGYMLPLVFASQLLGGVLVLSGRLTAVGLLVLAPMLVHIVAFHVALEPKGLGLVMVLVGIELALAMAYRRSFAGLFSAPERNRAAARDTYIPSPRLTPSAG